MVEREWDKKSALLKNEVIAAGLLLACAFFINRGIEIKGLYMDDLYLWSCYGEQSFTQFVFPIGSTRFRFVFYLLAWLELGLFGSHIDWFVPFNIFLNGCIAYTLHRFGKRLSGRWLIGLGTGFLYLLSRMSYYQISQVYGLMESLALWAAIGILYCLFSYINEEGSKKNLLIISTSLYFSVCFIHERYMVLLPLFYAAFLIKKEKQKAPWISITAAFCAVQAIRLVTIGSISPAGTAGTTVAETFSLIAVLKYAVSQVLYLLGINAGPSHLNGASWQDSPAYVHVLVVFSCLVLAAMTALFLIRVIKEKEQRRKRLSITALFLLFIALCIGSSSVTIRVETRWVYVSMTAAWLFADYMCGVVISKNEKRVPLIRPLGYVSLFLLYIVLMVPVESFYRGKYDNLYYWTNQLRYNSLAEETYGKYGQDLFGKHIYIIGNSYEMSDFTARTFFKTFDKARKAEGTTVQFVDSIYDFGLVTPNMLILREDPGNKAFQEITAFVKALKCENIYGYYPDGWLEESAKLRLITGKSGKIHVKFYYPGALTGNEAVTITVNGEKALRLLIDSSAVEAEIHADRAQLVELGFECNFYYEQALEQRGEKHLSVVAEFAAD